MGLRKKKDQEEVEKPRLVSRRMHREANLKIGRTISEKREKAESTFERGEIRKKGKRKKFVRVLFVILGFAFVAGVIACVMKYLLMNEIESEGNDGGQTTAVVPKPTVEIVDLGPGGHDITSRMKDYIGQAEQDWRDLGYFPVKAEIPSGSIRQVNFYLDGYTGYIKMTIDRDTAVSVEDGDRLIRYLKEKGIEVFEYIDVRVEGKGYWK